MKKEDGGDKLIPPSDASPEDALAAFMKVDPEKVKKRRERERREKTDNEEGRDDE